MARRRICVVTGSRADYGLLRWLMQEIRDDASLELQVVATGMHLSPEFGLTWRAIEEDGFAIDARVEMLLSSDTPSGIAKSIGLGVIGFADALERLRPDLLLLVGDRFEMLAVAQAALVARIPIAHLGGGDTTEGAYDEAIRHSITKMSHLHLVTNQQAANRVRQLGEDPASIFITGNPALDYIERTRLLSRPELEESLGYKFKGRNVLVTFHPATLEEQGSQEQFGEVLAALRSLSADVGFVFTSPNADGDGRVIAGMIEEFVLELKGRAVAHASLGQVRYLSMLSHVDVVVGNSSSGLCEVPTFRKPTVNIGDRQKGRLRAASVIDCAAERERIKAAIQRAFGMDCGTVTNPYGDGRSVPRIIAALKDAPAASALIRKHFHDIRQENEGT